MIIDFNSDKNKKKRGVKTDEVDMLRGDYEAMLKMRAKQLPKIQDAIRETLKDYEGTSIAIIVMKEDENGMPEGSHVVMAGCSRMESQIAMGKALSEASDKTMEILMESSKGDIKAMLSIAAALVNVMENDKE